VEKEQSCDIWVSVGMRERLRLTYELSCVHIPSPAKVRRCFIASTARSAS